MKRFPFISRFAASVAMVAMAVGSTCMVSCSKDDDTNQPIVLKQLDAPADPAAGLATESELSFSWKSVEGAQNYAAQIRLDKYGDIVKETITERQNVTFDKLENGTEYFFRVRANDPYTEKKNSAWTEWISSTTIAVEPQYKPLDAPKNPVCDMSKTTESSLTFQWEVVENAASYTWQLTANDLEPLTGITENLTVAITALAKGADYTFVVKANPAEGTPYRSSSYSKGVKASTIAVLATPSELKNTLKMAEALSFSWAAVDFAESYAYELVEGGTPIVTGFTGKMAAMTRAEGDFVAETTNTSVSFMNLKKSTYYQFRVKAVPGDGSMLYAESAFTDYLTVKTLATDATPLAAPVAASKDVNQVRATVAWAAVSGAASYKYQWGATQAEAEASEPVEIVADELGVLPTEFTKKSLTAASTYYTRVMACPDPADVAKGDSEYSAWVNIQTPAKVDALTISTADELLESFDRVNPGAVVTLTAGNYITNKTIAIKMAISFVGESATNRPVINLKQFTMAPTAACEMIKFQNIEFSCYALDADGNITPGSYLAGYFIDNSGQAADVESLVIDNCIVANGFKTAFIRMNRTNFGAKNILVTNNIVAVGGDDGEIIAANGKTQNVASWTFRNNTFDSFGSLYGATKAAQLIRAPTPVDPTGFTLTVENNTIYKGAALKGKNLMEVPDGSVVLKKNVIVVDPVLSWTNNIGVTNNLTSEDNFICNTTSTLTGFTNLDPQITGYVFLQNYRPTDATVIAAGAGDTRWL